MSLLTSLRMIPAHYRIARGHGLTRWNALRVAIVFAFSWRNRP